MRAPFVGCFTCAYDQGYWAPERRVLIGWAPNTSSLECFLSLPFFVFAILGPYSSRSL